MKIRQSLNRRFFIIGSPYLEKQFWYWSRAQIHKRSIAVYHKFENESKTNLHQLTLQVLSCQMNPVKYVHPGAFTGLLVLEHLRLRHTQLYQLPSLQHIGHSLTYLEIGFSTHFNGNCAKKFTYLRKIKSIEMYRNGLIRTPLGLSLIASTITVLNFVCNTIISLTSLEGVEFIKLHTLRLQYNNITHLHPEFLITPRLQILNLEGNHLVSLAEVTQYSWGSLLPKHKYMQILLRENPWHCNGSFIWMFRNLYKFQGMLIHAKPPFKPYIRYMDQLLCESPDARHGTTVVPMDIIESVNISIGSLRDLAGKCYLQFKPNVKWNFTNLKSFVIL